MRAIDALKEAQVIVTYKNYLKYIEQFSKNREIFSSGMMKEVERASKAIDFANEGKRVAVVSTGDAGIYGMAGLVLELLEKRGLIDKLQVEIVPGVSAINAAAAVAGAPIMHDFAVISLSDLLTDWDVIKKRVEMAALGDFVIALYNPKSSKRVSNISDVQQILLKHKSKSTPIAIVKNALRDNQQLVFTDIENLLNNDIDMLSIVIIGNSQSQIINKKYFITPRGYHKKY